MFHTAYIEFDNFLLIEINEIKIFLDVMAITIMRVFFLIAMSLMTTKLDKGWDQEPLPRPK